MTAAAALLVEIVFVIASKADGSLSSSADINRAFGSPGEIGRLFLTDHLLAFEITSVVLLVAAVGGVILGSHAKEGDGARARP
jgi:NADH-quinone oxidoreductase subunit J/NAD(P)H-quinone oxidoreductase subunit 6